MKVFILIKRIDDEFTNELTAMELELFKTIDEIINEIHDFYYDDKNEKSEFFNELETSIRNNNFYIDTDGNDPIEWRVFEREI